MDAAVVLKKRGAKRLDLLFDGPRESIHWHLPEAWFDTEGVEPRFSVQALGYQVNSDGRLFGVILEENECLETEMVVEAMGLFPDAEVPESDRVFVAGAALNGGASVQQCMQEGFDAAEKLDRCLRGGAA